MPYIASLAPTTEISSLLSTNWDTQSGNVPAPTFIVPNDPTVPARYDLRNPTTHDEVIIKPDLPAEEEQPIGTWIYGNHIWKIVLEIKTPTSRVRLWDIRREIRRICHSQMHSMTNFQRIQYKNFTELVEQEQRIWAGRINLELINSAELLEISY